MRQQRERRLRCASPRTSAGIEWFGGIVSMPVYVADEGEPYKPEVLFWLGQHDEILGYVVDRPGAALATASANLRSTIEQPLAGRPHAPARLFVSSPELADALRAGHPALHVIHQPSPQIDDILDIMVQRLCMGGAKRTYLAFNDDPESVASFFKAAAALSRAELWQLPDELRLISVTIESLGVRDAAMFIRGDSRQKFRLLLFSSFDELRVYLEMAESIDDESETVPRHLSLSFQHGINLLLELFKEIDENKWEVADQHTYPWLNIIDDETVPRAPTAKELLLTEAVALALATMMDEEKALRPLWEAGDSTACTFLVRTYQGDMEVILQVPHERAHELDTHPALAGIPTPASSVGAPPPARKKAANAKKNKRKAARKARKKNR